MGIWEFALALLQHHRTRPLKTTDDGVKNLKLELQILYAKYFWEPTVHMQAHN